MLYRFAPFILLLFFFSCTGEKTLPDSAGRAGEIIIVAEKHQMETAIGKALRDVLSVPQEGLPQEEPKFNIYPVTPNGFQDILKRNRNIIIIDAPSGDAAQPTVVTKKNVWARNQVVITLSAPDDSSIVNLVRQRGRHIANTFLRADMERAATGLMKRADKALTQKIQEKHHTKMVVPSGYGLVADTAGFFWLKQDVQKRAEGMEHFMSRGIFVFYEDYADETMLFPNRLLQAMDSITQKYIPGPSPGSYMQVFKDYPTKSEVNKEGGYTVELRGLWNTANDFMGGPFVSYTTVDTARNRVVTATAYLYAPNFDKRDYLREMEAVLRTIEFE